MLSPLRRDLLLCFRWKENRLTWLKRVLVLGGNRAKRGATAEFSHYRSGLIYFGIVDGLYSTVFKVRFEFIPCEIMK